VLFPNNGVTQSNFFGVPDLDHMMDRIMTGKTQEQIEEHALLEDEAEQGNAHGQYNLG